MQPAGSASRKLQPSTSCFSNGSSLRDRRQLLRRSLRRLEAREARGKKRGRPNALREELLSTARCDFEARAVVVAAPAPAAQLVPVVPSQLAVLKRQVAAISCETVGIITSDRGLTMNRIDSAVRDLLAAVSGDGAAGDLLDEDLLRILNHLQESALK